MARQIVVLALIFIAIVGSVSAQAPTKAPTGSPSPKAAPADTKTSPATAPATAASTPEASTVGSDDESLAPEVGPDGDFSGAEVPAGAPAPNKDSSAAAGLKYSAGTSALVIASAATATAFFY